MNEDSRDWPGLGYRTVCRESRLIFYVLGCFALGRKARWLEEDPFAIGFRSKKSLIEELSNFWFFASVPSREAGIRRKTDFFSPQCRHQPESLPLADRPGPAVTPLPPWNHVFQFTRKPPATHLPGNKDHSASTKVAWNTCPPTSAVA